MSYDHKVMEVKMEDNQKLGCITGTNNQVAMTSSVCNTELFQVEVE